MPAPRDSSGPAASPSCRRPRRRRRPGCRRAAGSGPRPRRRRAACGRRKPAARRTETPAGAPPAAATAGGPRGGGRRSPAGRAPSPARWRRWRRPAARRRAPVPRCRRCRRRRRASIRPRPARARSAAPRAGRGRARRARARRRRRPVHRDLRVQRVGDEAPRGVVDGHARFVAGGFDAEDAHGPIIRIARARAAPGHGPDRPGAPSGREGLRRPRSPVVIIAGYR